MYEAVGGCGGKGLEMADAAQDARERLSAVESTLPHMATKADIANLKVWALTALVTVAGIAVAITRFV